MVEDLEAGAVLPHHPRKEVIEGVPGFGRLHVVPHRVAGLEAVEFALLGEDLVARRDRVMCVAALTREGTGAVVQRIAGDDREDVHVALLIALQVIPAREDDAAEAIDERREHARWRVIEDA
ncbi:MAG: hypothetical protein NTZ61_06575 [Proteobacteria bacterium]|nr:hypothetical protein [Pseudomonadota bacterium]